MADDTTENSSPTQPEITPELLWSKYSLIQHLLFWLIALGVWSSLHWLGSTQERFTIPIWRYVAQVQSYGFTGDLAGDAVRGVLSGAVILLLILGSDVVVARVKGQPAREQILRNSHLLPRSPRQQFIAFLVGTNAGIFEELFFRGGLFTLLSLLLRSPELAILVTAALFALLHAPVQGWYSTAWIFLVGVFLNLLLLYSGSYYAPIFCHVTVNLGNLFIIPAFFDPGTASDALPLTGYADSPLSG